MTTAWLLTAILQLWLAAIAAMDLRSRKVRNWMVLLGLATGAAALFSGVQPFWVQTWSGLAGMLAAFAALLPFYAMRWMGAGDVKFAAVIGLWFGLSPYLLLIWIGGSLLAGMHGLLVLSWRHLQQGPVGLWLQAWLPAPMTTRLATAAPAQGAAPDAPGAPRKPLRIIPYAGYLAIAAMGIAWLEGPPLT
ncbi:A24 family peptidase [Delftia acidovorans]|uniref:A24 family peptidase n=1 Tax=Delftia acidovorans TaxID=80866 RepID=UPI003D133B57